MRTSDLDAPTLFSCWFFTSWPYSFCVAIKKGPNPDAECPARRRARRSERPGGSSCTSAGTTSARFKSTQELGQRQRTRADLSESLLKPNTTNKQQQQVARLRCTQDVERASSFRLHGGRVFVLSECWEGQALLARLVFLWL